MKQICIDARMLGPTGIGQYIKNLLIHLADAPIKLLALINPTQSNLPSKIELININSPIYSIKEQAELSLKIPSIDLFWTPHFNVPLLPIRAKKRLVTIHDTFHLSFFNTLSISEKMYAKLLYNAAVMLSDQIITVSLFSRAELVKHTRVKATKIEVIPSAVDQAVFYPSVNQKDREILKEKYQVERPFLLYVGSLKAHKNVNGLLNAFHLLKKQGHAELELLLVGSTLGRSESTVNLCHPQIRMIGAVPEEDLPLFYRSAELKIFPSFYEGFGLPPLEAMSCGCPTLVSNAGSLPEICGDGAHYFNPNSSAQLADILKKFLNDKESGNQLREKGIEQSLKFSWQACARRHMTLIERLVS